MTPANGDIDDEVATLFERSVLLGAIQRATDAVLRASTGSRMLVALRRVGRQYQDSPVASQVRLIGLALLGFAGTYLALTLVVPERAAPLYPAVICAIAGVAGVGCLAGTDAVAAAWQARRRRGSSQNSQA